jgi:hypothetical protein
MSNEYMLNLHKRLTEKTYGEPPRNLSDTTASAYIKTMTILNEKKPFKNLSFLKKTEEVMKKLATYADSTQKTLLASITSVLSLEKDKSGYKKTYKFYHDQMMDKAKTAKVEGGSTVANEKQTENWLTWEEVLNKLTELKEKVNAFAGEKKLSETHYNTLLSYIILSLYTAVPPRRNQDYLCMVVATKKKGFTEDKDTNYLMLTKKVPTEFVFNKYKTAKTYGRQVVPIPAGLGEALGIYLKRIPKNSATTLLVGYDGTSITQPNAITRILNKTFGKKIGSSMLRHIYLSSKYDINEMTTDATQMGHSLEEQKQYMKALPSPSDSVETPPPSS